MSAPLTGGPNPVGQPILQELKEQAKTLISDVDVARRHPFAKRPYTDEAWLTKVDQLASDLFDRPNSELLPFRNKMVAKLASALFLRCSSDQLVSFWRREWKSECTRNALGEAMSINLVQLRFQKENLLAEAEKFNPSAPLWTGPEAADGLDMDRIVYSAIVHKRPSSSSLLPRIWDGADSITPKSSM